jgi:hypothetical protein
VSALGPLSIAFQPFAVPARTIFGGWITTVPGSRQRNSNYKRRGQALPPPARMINARGIEFSRRGAARGTLPIVGSAGRAGSPPPGLRRGEETAILELGRTGGADWPAVDAGRSYAHEGAAVEMGAVGLERSGSRLRGPKAPCRGFFHGPRPDAGGFRTPSLGRRERLLRTKPGAPEDAPPALVVGVLRHRPRSTTRLAAGAFG